MSDFFKVVYIKELKEVEPISHLWEECGILYWPPSKKEVRLNQSNPKSVPNKRSWLKYTCTVKQNDILLFHHASIAADRICEDSSTEEEQELQPPTKKRVSKPPNKFIQNNYESYFECDQTSTSEAKKINKNPPEEPLVQIEVQNVDSNENEDTMVASNTFDSVFDLMVPNRQIEDHISKEFEKFSEKLYIYLNRRKYEFEQNFDHKFAEIGIRLDYIDKRLRECEVPPEKDQVSTMFPLSQVCDVQEFEHKLNTVEYKSKVLGHLRRVNGTGLFWKSACYKLSGFLFTKTLLTHYSWTGLSRTNVTKEAFNKLGNILDLFYRVVEYSDNSFNYTQRDSFFRDGVLKHSLTRLNGPKKRSLVQEIGKENIGLEIGEEPEGYMEEN